MTGSWGKWLRIPSLSDRLRSQGVREDVIAAAERTAFGRQTDRGLPALNEVLTKSEGVIQLVEGRQHGAYGLLVLTSRRLIFLPAESARDPLEQLAELRAMHDAGLIGDAEFQARKQDLFGQI